MAQVIVVGGGLAGLSAAHTLLERGANVLLLDKQGFVSFLQCLAAVTNAALSHSFMGGNSTKATSGINGAGTNAQKELNIPDSAKIFFDDTKKSVCVPISYSLHPLSSQTLYRPAILLVMTSLKSSLGGLEMR